MDHPNIFDLIAEATEKADVNSAEFKKLCEKFGPAGIHHKIQERCTSLCCLIGSIFRTRLTANVIAPHRSGL